jgi:type IV pilus assembly protein PilC
MKARYAAKNYTGEVRSGEMEVKDEKELAALLRSEDFVLTFFEEIKEKKAANTQISFWQKFSTIPLSEKMIFTRNLSVMIASGLPLAKALKNLSLQTKNKKFAAVLAIIQEDIQVGKQLSEGLARFPGIFNELFVNMVKVGEVGGNLEEVLTALAAQMEKEHDILRKTKGAFIYPIILLLAMIGIGFLMMIFVIPQMTVIFKDFDAQLPASTRFIIFLSDLLASQWPWVVSGMVVSVLALWIFSKTVLGKKIGGFVSIILPGISNLVIKLNCARFCRNYSSLLHSGMSIVETLQILSRTLGNFYYKRSLIKAAEEVQKGMTLSQLLYTEKRIFPILVPQMVEVGEETGKTEEVLAKLADFYEQEVDQLTKNLSSIIEPFLMLFIGTAVGFFALAILQPMYSLMQNIN